MLVSKEAKRIGNATSYKLWKSDDRAGKRQLTIKSFIKPTEIKNPKYQKRFPTLKPN